MNNTIRIKTNKIPKLKIPEMKVDKPLHPKLNAIELLSNLNYSHAMLILGNPGQGKTSHIIALLNSEEAFKHVFNKIYIFIPKASRNSIKDKFFDNNLNENQIYDILDYETLKDVYMQCMENAENDLTSLIIFDDVQRAFRSDANIEKLFNEMIANRRHSRASMWCLIQNYKKLPPPTRALITDMFIFNIGKSSIEDIFNEHIKLDKKTFETVLNHCFPTQHSFLYLNNEKKKIFSNWDEIELIKN